MKLSDKVDRVLVRQSARIADDVRSALRSSINVDEVVAAFSMTFHEGSSLTRIQAREWARINIRSNHRRLAMVLDPLYAIGWLLGRDLARAAVAEARRAIKKADDASASMNWDDWSPGNEPASLLVAAPGGLRNLLDRKPVLIKDIDDTTLDRIGTELADALAAGETDINLAARNAEIIGDPQRALMIATTEMNRAMSVATVDNYSELGVERMEWFALEGCDDCEENADFGPIEIGEEFPSGDTEPPAHPNCRCSLLPFIEGDSVATRSGGEDGSSDEEKGATVDVMRIDQLDKSGVPGPIEVERALSRLEILPNPNHPELKEPEKLLESPWRIVPVPTIDPNLWDDAKVKVWDLNDLYGTDPWLKRKNVRKHIESMGQALMPYRSYALIAVVEGRPVIIDGHHRLMASWLLGQDQAPTYTIEVS